MIVDDAQISGYETIIFVYRSYNIRKRVISWDGRSRVVGRLGSFTAWGALYVRRLGVYGGNCDSEDVKMKKFSGRGPGGLTLPANKRPSATVGWPGSPGLNLNMIGRAKKPAPRKSSAHQDETSPKSGQRKIRCQKPETLCGT
ncbi:hypothetical protein N7481_011450 [Penicillium waksmanii]|uniref:uncharacterized protein n=1 Tax=Penicillium waksmanii TaxID=69791 RepID=UPI002548073E|nr:uncharacterized protein N7481_011450 [Penicillium waksmanii]KAJ5974240.1 hypothetical protein N7481_011450 [Penicillium waksmanii]